jgi:hypothetical protein
MMDVQWSQREIHVNPFSLGRRYVRHEVREAATDRRIAVADASSSSTFTIPERTRRLYVQTIARRRQVLPLFYRNEILYRVRYFNYSILLIEELFMHFHRYQDKLAFLSRICILKEFIFNGRFFGIVSWSPLMF